MVRAVRFPLAVIVLALALLAAATVLDTRPPGTARELALTLGAPALLLLPVGVVWLAVALVLHRRRTR